MVFVVTLITISKIFEMFENVERGKKKLYTKLKYIYFKHALLNFLFSICIIFPAIFRV